MTTNVVERKNQTKNESDSTRWEELKRLPDDAVDDANDHEEENNSKKIYKKKVEKPSDKHFDLVQGPELLRRSSDCRREKKPLLREARAATL